jgi:signal transduction histidine kinase
MTALGRLILAASGLIVIILVPTEPDRLVPLTYGSLILYTLYSGAVYGLELRGRPIHHVHEWGPWIDVALYTLLISLSSGTNSIFFFGYFLAILAASFRWGFGPGFRVVLASTALFTAVGAFTTPGPFADPQRSVIRPIYLLTLGYMIARWGEHEIALKRRLELLRELAISANPRFGMNRTLGRMMHRLTGHFEAAGCALVLKEEETASCSLRRSVRGEPESVALPQDLPESVAQLLLTVPREATVLHHSGASRAFDAVTGERRDVEPAACEAIAAALDASSFVSVPLVFLGRERGRLYLAGSPTKRFDDADARFLVHAMGQALPVIENLRLVTELADAAAETERQKIARDIHDSVIQPFIGLQIGLSGLRQKVATGGDDIAADVDRLLEMTAMGIADLRLQVSALREGGERGVSLVPAVRRFATRFSEVTGIAVEVQADDGLRIEDRLAAEAFQMVAEGLANVRRHTHSPQATVGVALHDGALRLRIENPAGPEALPAFTPRSIAERAAALGGGAVVQAGVAGATVVLIEVPL